MRLPQSFFLVALLCAALSACHKDAPPAPVTPAAATVTHYDIVPDTLLTCVDSVINWFGNWVPVSSNTIRHIVLDLDSNGVSDVRFTSSEWYEFHSNITPSLNYQYDAYADSLSSNIQFYCVQNGTPLLSLLNANDTVYANQHWKSGGFLDYEVCMGPFGQTLSGTKYIAFRFRTGNGLFRYGWLRLTSNQKYYVYIQDWGISSTVNLPLRMGQL
jgi:hypothetical protein